MRVNEPKGEVEVAQTGRKLADQMSHAPGTTQRVASDQNKKKKKKSTQGGLDVYHSLENTSHTQENQCVGGHKLKMAEKRETSRTNRTGIKGGEVRTHSADH